MSAADKNELDIEQSLREKLKELHLCIDELRSLKTGESHYAISKLQRGGENVVEWLQQYSPLTLLKDVVSLLGQCNDIQKEQDKLQKRPVSKAPIGLLSLRDYSVLQASVEVIICWCIYPFISPGIYIPISKRIATKTLQISKATLSSVQDSTTASYVNVKFVTQVLCDLSHILISCEQLRPMLLPCFLTDLLTGFIACHQKEEKSSCLPKIFSKLPLKMCIAHLRQSLGQAAANTTAFKQQCGVELITCVMHPGGLEACVSVLLVQGQRDENENNDCTSKIAALLAAEPASVCYKSYLNAILPDLLMLLTRSRKEFDENDRLMRRQASLIIYELAQKHTFTVVDKAVFKPMLEPLLSLEVGTTLCYSESQVSTCLEQLLSLSIQCPVFNNAMQMALLPSLRPLITVAAYANTCKASIAQLSRDTVVGLLGRFEPSLIVTVIQCSVLVSPQPQLIRSTLKHDDTSHSVSSLSRGSSGGVVIESYDETSSSSSEKLNFIVSNLLQDEVFQKLYMAGDVFVALLKTYVSIKAQSSLLHDEVKSSTATIDIYKTTAACPKTIEDTAVLLEFLITVATSLGPAILQKASSILESIVLVLEASATAEDRGTTDNEDDEDLLLLVLGLCETIVEVGGASSSPVSADAAEKEISCIYDRMLPILASISEHENPQVSEMATSLRANILSRNTSENREPQLSYDTMSIDDVLSVATEDLNSNQTPIQARGVVRITKLVRRMTMTASNNTKQQLHKLFQVYVSSGLTHPESYVYLAAVQGIAVLGEEFPDVMIPTLTKALSDKKSTYSFEQRIKLSEALMFTARRRGEGLYKYTSSFIHAYLDCIKPTTADKSVPELMRPLVEEVGKSSVKETQNVKNENALAIATLRASCLSNLSETCDLLQWGIHPYIVDIVSCVIGVLQMELCAENIPVRRGAAYLIFVLLSSVGSVVLQLVPEMMTSLYRVTKWTADRVQSNDDVTRLHASNALAALDEIMKGRITSAVSVQSSSALLSSDDEERLRRFKII